MNTCTDVRALLPLVVGGDLEEAQALAVTEHLEQGCAACAAALRELQRTRAFLLELPERSPAPAADLWPGVRKALVAQGILGRPSIRVRRAPVGWVGMSLSAAAASVLVAGALWALIRGDSTAPEALPAPQVAEGGVTSDLPPTLVGGPDFGGLRPLAAGEEPFANQAEYFGAGAAAGARGPRFLAPDPSRPTLASDRGGN